MGRNSRNAHGRTAAEQRQADEDYYRQNAAYWARQRHEQDAARERAAQAEARKRAEAEKDRVMREEDEW